MLPAVRADVDDPVRLLNHIQIVLDNNNGVSPEKTYDYIWGTWFLSTKEKLDSRSDFELYDRRYRGFDHPDNEVDIYIPIK